MSKRDRKHVIWLLDLIDNELAAVEFYPTIRRLNASKAMLQRWLDDDDRKRST